jgi:hypothetical protein
MALKVRAESITADMSSIDRICPICTLQRAGASDRVTQPFSRHLGRRRWTHRGQWAAPPMTSKRHQEKRRKLWRGHRALDECAPTQGHGMAMPIRPAGLDPIVAEIIEALARTIIRDEDRRASLPLMNKNE